MTQDEIAVWAIEADGAVVGLIQADEETEPQYRHASIDIVLASGGQDRGLGSDAVRTVARWLLDVRGHHRLTIDPAAVERARDPGLLAGRAFARSGSCAATSAARDRTWHDGLLMDLLAGELSEPDQPGS